MQLSTTMRLKARSNEENILEIMPYSLIEDKTNTFLQTIIQIVKYYNTQITQKQTNAFDDIVFCEICGKTMQTFENKVLCLCGKNKPIHEKELIKAIKSALLRDVLLPKNIETLFRREKKLYGKRCVKALAEKLKLQNKLKTINANIKSLLILAQNNFDLAEDFNELKKQRREIIETITDIDNSIKHIKLLYSDEKLEDYIKAVRASIVDAEGDILNQALKNISAKITIGDDIDLRTEFNS